MLAVYKGKEYICGSSFWDKKIELRSRTQPDGTFEIPLTMEQAKECVSLLKPEK